MLACCRRCCCCCLLLTIITPLHLPVRYPVRVAVIDLDTPPAWFSQRQAADHMTADLARQFASTNGECHASYGLGMMFEVFAVCSASSTMLHVVF